MNADSLQIPTQVCAFFPNPSPQQPQPEISRNFVEFIHPNSIQTPKTHPGMASLGPQNFGTWPLDR